MQHILYAFIDYPHLQTANPPHLLLKNVPDNHSMRILPWDYVLEHHFGIVEPSDLSHSLVADCEEMIGRIVPIEF